jgi:hypothetical protein
MADAIVNPFASIQLFGVPCIAGAVAVVPLIFTGLARSAATQPTKLSLVATIS